jgi:antitoxin component HigA of HigAB toxin-antitoxin module
MMTQPLQTEAEYRAALDEVARLFDATDNTPEAGAVVIPLRA